MVMSQIRIKALDRCLRFKNAIIYLSLSGDRGMRRARVTEAGKSSLSGAVSENDSRYFHFQSTQLFFFVQVNDNLFMFVSLTGLASPCTRL